ncbi:MAG TPA: UvrD-helicase domain-containing protein [Gemmatimonadaceae bacterium]|nr:UvrD-helicase domain-containing protein [Gemmatimonadaceae bacterium]
MTAGTNSTSLNAAQREAVEHGGGPLLVLAGAGSGKTRVLTARIARLINEEVARADQILAVTFTNKAAREMRDRVGRLLGYDPRGMWIGTFHAIGARIVRAHAAVVGRTPAFTIYDEDDTLGVVKRLMERHRVSTKVWTPRLVAATVSEARNALVSPAEYESLALTPLAKAVAPLYKDWDAAFRAANAVSFDDLLWLPVAILRQDASARARLQARFAHLLVDEYQDTNRAQYELIRLLASVAQNVCAVGDDDQAIYGWRGADVRNILDFERDFPSARVVRLEENYRSVPEVLDLANVVIRENRGRRGKTLRPTRPAGEPVTLVGAADDRDEAEAVIEEIEARRGRGEFALGDIAILYRTNSQSRTLEEAFRRHGMPYRLIGAVRFYDRREVRDLLAWLRLIANPNDIEAFTRAVAAPRRGVGEATVEMLIAGAREAGLGILDAAVSDQVLTGARPATRQALARFVETVRRMQALAAEASVDVLLSELVSAIGFVDALRTEPDGAERIENVAEMIRGAAEVVIEEGGEVGLRPLDRFLQQATLVAGVDELGPGADVVTMMTLHTAKGLEFPFVVIAGLEDGLFPLSRSADDPERLEEERRLFYVGITRAERVLMLTWARSRRRNGELIASRLSSFVTPEAERLLKVRQTARLRSTPRVFGGQRGGMTRDDSWDDFGDDVPRWRPDPHREVAVEVEDISQDAPSFAVGERVRHGRFGSGVIAGLSGAGRDAKVTVQFDDEAIGTKKLVVAFAGLERGFD